MIVRRSVGLLIMLAACALLVPKVTADLIYVPNDYPSITQACAAAEAGDTVAVFPGDYYPEYVIVPPGVSVIGLGANPTQVRVFPASYASCFYVSRGEEPVLIENLTAYEGSSGVIWNLNPHLLVRRCHLVQTVGYMLILTSGDFELHECLIDFACWLGHCEGLFVCVDPVHILVEDCVFSASELPVGVEWPIGWVPAGSCFEFRNNTFIGNLQIWIDDGWSTDFSAFFVNNIITEGAGCYYTPPDTLEWRYNDFVDPGHPYFWPTCGYQVGNFSEDPLFCDPDEEDYRLDPDSPCIGAGEGGEDVGARLGICWPQDMLDRLPQREGALRLTGPWPNPTAHGVDLYLEHASAMPIDIQVWDVAGSLVRTLSANNGDGITRVHWDGWSANGRAVPAGVYYVRLTTPSSALSRRVIVVR